MTQKTILFFAVVFALVSGSNARDLSESVAHFKAIVFRVESVDKTFKGTAFTINANGDLLTCYHVVSEFRVGVDTLAIHAVSLANWTTDSGAVQVETRARFRVKVKAVFPSLDMAVLSIAETGMLPKFAFSPLSASGKVKEGEEVVLCAFIPDNYTLPKAFVSKGIVSTVRDSIYDRGLGKVIDIFQMDLTASKGTSGGPVFLLSSGEIAGIQDAGLFESDESSQTPYPIAIKIHQVLPMLDSLKIPYLVRK